jgi:DNA invertase Pin-like site-specific DNA recombinase
MVASIMFGLAEIEIEYRRERQAVGISVAKTASVYKSRKKGTAKGNPEMAKILKVSDGKILQSGRVY